MVNKNKFCNIILIIFVIWLIKLSLYAIELKNFSNYLSLSSIIFFVSFIVISLIFIFKKYNKIKFILTINFFLFFSFLTITSFIYDFYYDYLYNKKRSILLNKRINFAEKNNIKFDKRNKFEFLNELKKTNKNASFAYNPSIILKEFSENKKKITEILPLSGLSNTINVDCNESGFHSTFISDRYGFNNYDSVYNSKEKKIILIGDSFVQGQCVEQKNTISNKLNQKGYNSISLGLAGNGPLLELAILKEYGVKLNPSKIIWFFFENDIRDLEKNSKIEILKKYYNTEYTQMNIERQIEINKFWKRYEKKKIKEKKENIEKRILKKIERAIFLKSYKDFIVNLYKREYIEYEKINSKYINKFIEIIKISKKITEKNNAQFYFVYLPSYDSLLKGEPKSKKIILNEIKKLNINLIDFQEEMEMFNEPLLFFPFKLKGHFTADGYELLTNKIKKEFLE